MMRGRAHTTDAAGDLRHVLGRSTAAEHLEPAQLRDLKIGTLYIALVIEEDVDLAVAFQAGDGVDGHLAAFGLQSGVGLTVRLVPHLLAGWVHRASSSITASTSSLRRSRLLARP